MLHCFCSFQLIANYISALWVQHRGQTLWISLKSLLFCGSLLLPPSPHCPFFFCFFCAYYFYNCFTCMKDFAKKDWLLEVQGWSKWLILWHSFLAVEFIKKLLHNIDLMSWFLHKNFFLLILISVLKESLYLKKETKCPSARVLCLQKMLRNKQWW